MPNLATYILYALEIGPKKTPNSKRHIVNQCAPHVVLQNFWKTLYVRWTIQTNPHCHPLHGQDLLYASICNDRICGNAFAATMTPGCKSFSDPRVSTISFTFDSCVCVCQKRNGSKAACMLAAVHCLALLTLPTHHLQDHRSGIWRCENKRCDMLQRVSLYSRLHWVVRM